MYCGVVAVLGCLVKLTVFVLFCCRDLLVTSVVVIKRLIRRRSAILLRNLFERT